MNKKQNRYMPLLLAISMAAGIVIGTFFANRFSGNRLNIINSGSNRLNNLLHIIDDQYVDAVNLDSLVDTAIPQILSDLDPHSVYITAKDAQIAADDLKGSFSGVGIEFMIREDTVHIQGIIKNGPAERAGLLAGDKKVKTFEVTRGDIPVRSVTSTYMIDEETGYIKIKNFGANTYAEMLIALAKLSQEGFSNLVIDLRENTGGYLESAVQIINEFLPSNKLIVYTQGRKSPRHEYKSNGKGSYQKIPLVILINEGSASASEIFAGAIQDNDRGTIIGRRSFGKGLVQQQLGFTDGSMIRLTIARYYTPSGRCIQKPYTPGDGKDYEGDIVSRYQHGEFFSQDSIKHTGPAYHTGIGRTVYGGGGITPDIFVPEDTTNVTSYYKQAAMNGLILQFAFAYTDNNRQKLSEFTEMTELNKYLIRQNTVEQFAVYADNHGLKRRNLMIQKSHTLLQRYINSRIIYNILDEDAWTAYLNQDDDVIKKALGVFKNNEAFPKKPDTPTSKK